MDSLIKCVAYISLGVVVLYILLAPFIIGKERGIFKASDFLYGLILDCAILTLLSGRVLGWW